MGIQRIFEPVITRECSFQVIDRKILNFRYRINAETIFDPGNTPFTGGIYYLLVNRDAIALILQIIIIALVNPHDIPFAAFEGEHIFFTDAPPGIILPDNEQVVFCQ